MRYYGKISKCNAKMTNNELNNKFDILWDTVYNFSEKYNIYIRTGHSFFTDEYENTKYNGDDENDENDETDETDETDENDENDDFILGNEAYTKLGNIWEAKDEDKDRDIDGFGAWVVKEVYISREHYDPEFNKCYKKMFYMGINKNGNAHIENKNGKLICESEVNTKYIHEMLLDFITNYLKFFVNPKTYSLTDFIK